MKDQLSFSRFLILHNPASTHSRQVGKRIKELRELFPSAPIDIIETARNGRQTTIKRLEAHVAGLQKDTLFCVAGGDGTANLVVEWLAQDTLPGAVQRTPILPLWGGNANDLAHMLNGAAYRVRLRDLFHAAHIVPIYPLRCEITTKQGQTHVRIAACYIGFGATAAVARRLNESDHRSSRVHRIPGGRRILEALTLLRVLMHMPSFDIKEAGDTRRIYERSFINGSRMAKLHPLPVRLTDISIIKTTVDKRSPATLLRRLRTAGSPIEKTAAETTFTCKGAVWAQFDGEPMRIAAGSTVTVNRANKPFYALSLRLRAPQK